jgi:hypothetical protein
MLKIVSFHIQAHLNAFIDNSLGPLARESPCTYGFKFLALLGAAPYTCIYDISRLRVKFSKNKINLLIQNKMIQYCHKKRQF